MASLSHLNEQEKKGTAFATHAVPDAPRAQCAERRVYLSAPPRLEIQRSALIARFKPTAARAEERRRPRWRRWRDWGAFPGSNGVHNNLDSGQCALDFTLHALNLGLQKLLQFLEFRR
jgi:hypothetical protein